MCSCGRAGPPVLQPSPGEDYVPVSLLVQVEVDPDLQDEAESTPASLTPMRIKWHNIIHTENPSLTNCRIQHSTNYECTQQCVITEGNCEEGPHTRVLFCFFPLKAMVYSSFSQNKAQLCTKAKTSPNYKLHSAAEVSGAQTIFFFLSELHSFKKNKAKQKTPFI